MTRHQQTARPWLDDTLEGHAGNALMMKRWLDEDIRQDQLALMRRRLEMSLQDLALRMDEMGLRSFETERVKVVRTDSSAEVFEREPAGVL